MRMDCRVGIGVGRRVSETKTTRFLRFHTPGWVWNTSAIKFKRLQIYFRQDG